MILSRLIGRTSLRTALVVYVVAPLLVAVAGASFVALRAWEKRAERQMQEDVQLIARAVRLPLSRALERGRESEVDRALRSAFRIGRVYGAYVYDETGRRIATAGIADTVPERGRLTELAELGDRTGEYGEVGGREVYSYFVPLTDTGGRSIGLLQVTRRRREIRAYLGRLRLYAAGFLVVGGAIMVGLVLYGHHGAIGRHLNRLSGAMARVGRVDRAHRVSPEGPVEIAALTQALNDMLDGLATAEREVVDRRDAQRELELRLHHAERLASIGRLAAGIAHELGTPLSVVDGKAQRLLRPANLSPKVEQSLEEIRTEVRRMERIVRQLLDFARHSKLRKKRISAERLARSAVAAVGSEGKRLGVVIEADGPDPAPELDVDPLRMEQALTNLLRNAVQASADGRAAGAERRVRLSWFTAGDQAGFVVDDDGTGIAQEERVQIFEPFYTTKPVGAGTGLGLSVVHGVVGEHGGEVDVDDSPLGGARFRVRVPVAEVA